MKRVFIIHRWSGGPHDDWRPWLESELTKKGYDVIVPEMPDTETPVIEKWVSHLTSMVGTPDSDTYFVGHSIGCQAILRYLATINQPVGGAVFVAGWVNLEHMEDDDVAAVARPWIETPIDFAAVKRVLPRATLVISDNDPFGAFEENKAAFEKLGATIVVQHGAGHMTGHDGFVTFPALLAEVEKIMA